MKNCIKILNIIVMALMVVGSISWLIEGFFYIDALSTFFGPKVGRTLYRIIGASGIYGVHLFIDYARVIWNKK